MKKILSPIGLIPLKAGIIIACFILYISSGVSAQYANLQAKEAYDIGRQWMQGNYLNALSQVDVIGGPEEPERLQAYKAVAENIQSQINMYRITKDKAYLIKAINMSLDLVNNRYDYSFYAQTDHKTWADFNNSDETKGYWYDGFMAAAIAELAYILIAEPGYSQELRYLPLPVPLIHSYLPLPSYPPYIPVPMTNYGDIGEWFRDRVNETMVYYYTNYWANDAGFLFGDKPWSIPSVECDNKFYHKGLVGLNQHSPFTVASMYLKAIDPNATMGSVPGKIAAFYFSEVPLFKDQSCDLDLLNNTAECQNPKVMHLNETYNAYWWFHFGWSRGVIKPNDGDNDCANPCRRQCSNLTEFMEDFSHAGIAMEFPIHSIPFLGQYFNSDEMIRWKNTFTKLIWDRTYNGFHSAVIGNDIGIDNHGCYAYPDPYTCNGVFNCPCFREVPLLFAPLYKFDDAIDPSDPTSTFPKVYNIVMNFYQNIVEPAVIAKDGSWLNDRVFYGLSRTVSAQWDKECANLTLYNRDVVYNQDFFSKNILTIAPEQTTDPFYTATTAGIPSSFADPIIQTPTFTIEANTTVNMTAGERIVVKSGSSALLGCNFHAYIDPNLAGECMNGSRVMTNNDNPKGSVSSSAITLAPNVQTNSQIQKSTNVTISPNPTTGIFSLQLKEGASSNVFIYNNLGQIIYQQVINSLTQQIDLSAQPKGIYFIKMQNSDTMHTEKVVIQ